MRHQDSAASILDYRGHAATEHGLSTMRVGYWICGLGSREDGLTPGHEEELSGTVKHPKAGVRTLEKEAASEVSGRLNTQLIESSKDWH